MTDFTGLQIGGRIATPGDSDWDEVRPGWNLHADLRPDAVAFPERAEDIASIVGFAAENGIRVSGQSTGHGADPLPPLEGTILIRTERMRGVEVDPGSQTARVEAGVLSIELGEAANEHGLCFLPGSSPDVGVTGYTLGGGLSWFARRYGFACNRVAAIELVTADGESRVVDADNDDDLFWALRGGGGAYAIVTALRLNLVPVAEVYAGALLFPAAVGADAVRRYRDWAAELPDEVTSIVRFVTPPELPDVPEPLRGTPLLTITATCIGSREEGEATMAPMREIGETIMDTFDQVPTAALSRINMDPEEPVPAIGDGNTLRELPDEAIEAWVAAAGAGSGMPMLLSEIRHLGGALGRPAEGGGALDRIDAGFVMYSVGIPMTPELAEAQPAFLDSLEGTMAPWSADGAYYNFSDRAKPLERIHTSDVCTRLAEVKAKWDPDGRIVAKHELTPAA